VRSGSNASASAFRFKPETQPETRNLPTLVKCDLKNRLTNFNKIWHSDASEPGTTSANKILHFYTQDGGSYYVEQESCAIAKITVR